MVNVLFFGMDSRFSTPPLEILLKNGVNVSAVIVPAAQKTASPGRLDDRPTAPTRCPDLVRLAAAAGVPAWQVGSLQNPATLNLLRHLQPDLVAVACFPWLFPPALLRRPRFGCLNLHPSLLPAYRGPEPLFWIAYFDERVTGVTLHFMSKSADAGDIVGQEKIGRPDGMTGGQLEQRCAEVGGSLLLDAVQRLELGQLLPRRPQVETEASYYPPPAVQDFVIPFDWPARRAFNFLRGASGWPLRVDVAGHQFAIRVAKSYSTEHTLQQPFILLGDELWVQFSPGVLRAKIWPDQLRFK